MDQKNNQQQKPPFIITAPKQIISSAFEHISDFNDDQTRFIVDENGKKILQPYEFEKQNIKAGHTDELFHPIIYEIDPFERQECIERFDKLKNQVQVPQPFKCPKTHQIKQKQQLKEDSQKFGKKVLIKSLKRLSSQSQNKQKQQKIGQMLEKAEKLFTITKPLAPVKQKVNVGFDKSLFNQINKWKVKLKLDEKQKEIKDKNLSKSIIIKQIEENKSYSLSLHQKSEVQKSQLVENLSVEHKDTVIESKIDSKPNSVKQNSVKSIQNQVMVEEQNKSIIQQSVKSEKQKSIKSQKQIETQKAPTPKSGQSKQKQEKSEKNSKKSICETKKEDDNAKIESKITPPEVEKAKSNSKLQKDDEKAKTISKSKVPKQSDSKKSQPKSHQNQSEMIKKEENQKIIMKPKNLNRARSVKPIQQGEEKTQNNEAKRSQSQGKQSRDKIEAKDLKIQTSVVEKIQKKHNKIQDNQEIKQSEEIEKKVEQIEQKQEIINEVEHQKEDVNFGLVNINAPIKQQSNKSLKKQEVQIESIQQSQIQESQCFQTQSFLTNQEQNQIEGSVLSNQMDLVNSQIGESKLLIRQGEDDKESIALSESQVTVQNNVIKRKFKY